MACAPTEPVPVETPAYTFTPVYNPLGACPPPQQGLEGKDWTTLGGFFLDFTPESEDWSGIWATGDPMQVHLTPNLTGPTSLSSRMNFEADSGMLSTTTNQYPMRGRY